MDAVNLSYPIVFMAGLISFLSPCVLPLIPSYVSFITGLSFEDFNDPESLRRVRLTTVLHTLMFILGFSVVFVALGASATVVGTFLTTHLRTISKIGGVAVIGLGLYLAGVIRWAPLAREVKFHLQSRPLGYLGSGVVGVTFAAGWTPCIGPILGAILVYAGTQQTMTSGLSLLAVYSLGLGVPFLAAALAVNTFFRGVTRVRRHLRYITVAAGVFLIFVGILLVTDYLALLAGYMNAWFLPYFPFLSRI